MKAVVKYILALYFVAALAVGLMVPVQAEAKSSAPYLEKAYTLVYQSDPEACNQGSASIMNCPEKFKIKNLKVSNKKVVMVSWREGSKYIDCVPLKVGKVTLSFDIIYGKKNCTLRLS